LYNKIFLLSEPKAGYDGEFWVISIGVAIIYTVSANLWAPQRETRIPACSDSCDSGARADQLLNTEILAFWNALETEFTAKLVVKSCC